MVLSPGDKLSLCETVTPIGEGGTGARDAPPRASKSDEFGLADLNNSSSTKLTDFLFPELRQGRSDQGSLPCSTQPRSPSQTPPSSRHTHRLPRLLGAGSSNRRGDRRACRSTWFCPSPDRSLHTRLRMERRAPTSYSCRAG